MGRKVFLSVLGSTNYGECKYVVKSENFKSKDVRFIQEAMLDYLQAKNWEATSVGYVFVTKGNEGSKKRNWFDNGHIDRDTKYPIQCEGLDTRIQELNLPFKINPIEIPDGNSEVEIWEVFNDIYNCLSENDEIYFDITHGFRFLPMLAMVLLNYSKFLKNIIIKHISYGNYEGRNFERNEAPIINLVSLSNLQDWTSAASDFLSFGSLKKLSVELFNYGLPESEVSNIEKFSQEIYTNRGLAIIEGNSVSELKHALITIQKETPHAFFEPIQKEILKKIDYFKKNDLINGFRAVQFCINHKLAQQGFTLLEEFIKSYILHVCEYSFEDENNRNLVSGCLLQDKYKNVKIEIAVGKLKYEKLSLSEKEALNKLCIKVFELPYKKKLTKELMKKLSSGSRNDINHSGFRKDPKTPEYFFIRLKEYFEMTIQLLNIKL